MTVDSLRGFSVPRPVMHSQRAIEKLGIRSLLSPEGDITECADTSYVRLLGAVALRRRLAGRWRSDEQADLIAKSPDTG